MYVFQCACVYKIERERERKGSLFFCNLLYKYLCKRTAGNLTIAIIGLLFDIRTVYITNARGAKMISMMTALHVLTGFIGFVSRLIILFNFSIYKTRSETSANKYLYCARIGSVCRYINDACRLQNNNLHE